MRRPSRFKGQMWLAVAVTVALAAPAFAQHRDFEQVQITSVDLGGGVYMLQGAGGNMGLSAGEDGAFLVDTEFAPLTDKIVAAVAAASPRSIRLVLDTHWHADHVGGNENLARAGALIIAHRNVRARMSVDQVNATLGRVVPAAPGDALPKLTFTDQVTLHLNGETIRVLHLPPAHTDGDSVVQFENAHVMHTGDIFFNDMYPYIDVSAGGSLDGMIAACDRILQLATPDTKIVPGHGRLASLADLEAYRQMLAGVREAVAPLVADGKSLEEIKALDPLAPFNERWGQGLSPDRFLSMVYASLTR